GQTVKVWEATAAKEVLALDDVYGVESVALGPDGKRLAAGRRGVEPLTILDTGTGRRALNLKGHVGPVLSVAFSPDGKCLASASEDMTVKVLDAATGKAILTFKGHRGFVSSVAFSPDGKRLASTSHFRINPGILRRTSPGEVKLWDAATG